MANAVRGTKQSGRVGNNQKWQSALVAVNDYTHLRQEGENLPSEKLGRILVTALAEELPDVIIWETRDTHGFEFKQMRLCRIEVHRGNL